MARWAAARRPPPAAPLPPLGRAGQCNSANPTPSAEAPRPEDPLPLVMRMEKAWQAGANGFPSGWNFHLNGIRVKPSCGPNTSLKNRLKVGLKDERNQGSV